MTPNDTENGLLVVRERTAHTEDSVRGRHIWKKDRETECDKKNR